MFSSTSTNINQIGPIFETNWHAGEILAYRAWKVFVTGSKDVDIITLNSIYYEMLWKPGQPVKREQTKFYDIGDYDLFESYYGIHAYKTMDLLRQNLNHLSDNSMSAYYFLVLGKVKLWGEIIEHELGYRSEFGQIVSIDELAPSSYFTRNPYHHTQLATGRQVMMKKVRKTFREIKKMYNNIEVSL